MSHCANYICDYTSFRCGAAATTAITVALSEDPCEQTSCAGFDFSGLALMGTAASMAEGCCCNADAQCASNNCDATLQCAAPLDPCTQDSCEGFLFLGTEYNQADGCCCDIDFQCESYFCD